MKRILISMAALAAMPVAAHAADLYVPQASAPIAAAAPASTWDGPYVGVFAGYDWSSTDYTGGGGSSDDDGFLLGLQAGYNFHLSDAIVAGVAADIAYADVTDDTDSALSMDWNGSVVGKLGVDVGGIVPYLLGGVTFANVGYDGSDKNVRTGYTVGAGVEFSLASNLTADVEYRYANYGNAGFGTSDSVDTLSDNSVRVGLNYHF